MTCPTCVGNGEVLRTICGHRGACPCDGVPVPCPDCVCSWCGENGATARIDGELMHEDPCVSAYRAMRDAARDEVADEAAAA